MTKLIRSLFTKTPKQTILQQQQAQCNYLDQLQTKVLSSMSK